MNPKSSSWLSRAAVVVGAVGIVATVLGSDSRRAPGIPDWVVYPGEEWAWLNAKEAGLHPERWAEYISATPSPGGCGGDIHSDGRWGTCVQRGGYMLHCWGDPDYVFNSASAGKAFNGFVLQLAIDRGLVTGDEQVSDVWPECPSDCGEASTLRNLFHMKGGFKTSNGFLDGCNNKACGGGGGYSTGGQWRLNQALTHIVDGNLKDFLDRELFRHIGIEAEGWYWLSGKDVHANLPPPNASPEQKVLYPQYTAKERWYGCFIDPPYVVRGHVVVGGGGWVGMSPKDLARIGLLLASNGYWAGRKLISKTDLVDGHEGCGGSDIRARGGDSMFAWGRVATLGVEFPDDSLVVGPIRVKNDLRTEPHSRPMPSTQPR